MAAGVVALLCSTAFVTAGAASVDAEATGANAMIPEEDAVIVDIEPAAADTVTVFLPERSTDDPEAAAERLADDASIPVHEVSVRRVEARVTQYVNGQLVEGGELYRTEIRTELDSRTGPLSGTVPSGAVRGVAPTDEPTFVLGVPPGTAVDLGSARSRSLWSARYELSPSDLRGEDAITYRFPVGSINALAALLVASTVGVFGVVRYRARSVADGPESRTALVHAVRMTRVNAVLLGSAVAAGIALWLGGHSLVSLVAGELLPEVPGGAWWTVTRWTVALAPFVCGVWLASSLATEPVVRDLMNIPYDPLVYLADWGKSAVFRVGRYWVAGVVLLTLAPAVVQRPLLGGVVVALLMTVDQFLRPLAIRVFNDTGAVPGEVGREVTEFCDRQDLSVRGIRLLGTDDDRHADALAAGFAGYYWVFLTDDLLGEFDAEEIRALVAHELGHVRHRHFRKQVLFTLGYWALAFTAAVRASLGLWAFVAAAWVYRFGMRWLAHGQEYQADEYAATATSPDALVGALDRVGSVNSALGNGGIAHDYGASPPAIEDRIARLREDEESAEESSVEDPSVEEPVVGE